MPHLLVVEDDERVRSAVIRALRDRGHAVSSAGTALEGLRAAVEDAKKAELTGALSTQKDLQKASSAEEAAFQVEVRKQIEAKQQARRNRAQILRGVVTKEKSDLQELHDITHHHHERDIASISSTA